jgi:hypothetical protein
MRELRCKFSGGLAVEADAVQVGTLMFQQGKVVCLRATNRRIQAAFPFARGNHIPQADAVRFQPLQAFRVWLSDQIFTEQNRQQPPELVNVLVNLTHLPNTYPIYLQLLPCLLFYAFLCSNLLDFAF